MKTRYLVLGIISTTLLAACGVNIAERNNTANSLSSQQSYDPAVDIYYAVQVEQPDNPLLYFNASGALLGSEQFETAIASLEQAIKASDDALAAKAYHNIGNIYFQQSLYEEAIIAYREALLRNPNDEATRYNLELAMFFRLPPTPTALEQKTEPENDNSDPSATPTPNPGGEDEPTPTPTPPEEAPPDPSDTPVAGITGDEAALTPSTPQPRTNATMSIEEARRQLDTIQQDQRTLREFQQDAATPLPPPSGKDW